MDTLVLRIFLLFRPIVTSDLRARSVLKTGWFAGTLEWLTVDCCYHFLLVEGGAASSVAGGQHPVLGRAVLVSRGGWYQVTVSLHRPSNLSRILDHMGLARGGWRSAIVLRSPCAVRPVNSCQICSDARNIGLFITATISVLPTCRHVITIEYKCFHVNKNRCTSLL